MGEKEIEGGGLGVEMPVRHGDASRMAKRFENFAVGPFTDSTLVCRGGQVGSTQGPSQLGPRAPGPKHSL